MNNLITFLWMRYKLATVAVPAGIIATPFALWGSGVAPVWCGAVVLVLVIALAGLLFGVKYHLDELRQQFMEAAMLYYVHNANEAIISDTKVKCIGLFIRAVPWAVRAGAFDMDLEHETPEFRVGMLVVSICNYNRGEWYNRWYVRGGSISVYSYPAGSAPPIELRRLLIQASK